MIFNSLEELPGSRIFLAVFVYVKSEEWGTFCNTFAEEFPTREEAEKKLDLWREGYAEIYSDIRSATINISLETITEQLVGALCTERTKLQEEMSKTLTEYDEKLSSLLAITHQPEQKPEASPLIREINRKKDYILELCRQLMLHSPARVFYHDEEDASVQCESLEELSTELWSCDFERVYFEYPDGKLCLFLAWDNKAEEIVCDYSFSDQTMTNWYEEAERSAKAELDIPF